MKHSLTTEYAKNYSNWTHIIQVIVENVVTCFFLRHSVLIICLLCVLRCMDSC